MARSVERGVCPWCHAEIEYLADDACCPCCDARIAPRHARELLASRDEPAAVAPRIQWSRRLQIAFAWVFAVVVAVVYAARAIAFWLPSSARF